MSLSALGSSVFSLWLIAGVAAISSVAALIGLARRVRRDRAREAQLLRLQAEVGIFVDAALTVGERLARVERAPQAAPTGVAPAPSPFRQPEQVTGMARDLAERGAGVDDLVAACDLSRSEAGLVIALQRRGRRVLSAA